MMRVLVVTTSSLLPSRNRSLVLLLWLKWLLFAGGVGVALAASESKNDPSSLLEWFREDMPGTFVHEALEIRSRSSSGAGVGLGWFAKDHIQEGELILKIPRSLVLTPLPPAVGDHVNARVVVETEGGVDNNNEDNDIFVDGVVKAIDPESGTYAVEGRRSLWNNADLGQQEETGKEVVKVHSGVEPQNVAHLEQEVGINCGLVRRMMEEIVRGDASAFAPWLKAAVKDLSTNGNKQPGAWSPAGKELLWQVLGTREITNMENGKVEVVELLPPLGSMNALQEYWVNMCQHGNKQDSDDPNMEEEIAFFLTLQRSHSGVFVPMLDLLGHRNGEWTNVVHNSIAAADEEEEDEEMIRVTAIRDILPGQELLASLNFCEPDCEPRHYDWGTPEILRDYGFVEQYPQRWVFYFDYQYVEEEGEYNNKIVFDIDEEDDGTFKIIFSGHFRLPGEKELAFFQEQLTRLEELGTTKFYGPNGAPKQKQTSVPDQEWNVIVQYHEALVSALEELVRTVRSSLDADAFEVFVQGGGEQDEEENEEEEVEQHTEEEEFLESELLEEM